jgi:Cu-Zn family superoxide dismutase
MRSPRMQMRNLIPWRPGGARRALAVALAIGLGACASGDDPGQRGAKPAGAIGARLGPIGGGIGHGLITFRPYDGGLVIVADIGGFNAGPHRIVIHSNPVCTSPNGFSAGPPFVLPSTGAAVIVTASISHQGTASFVTRIPGLTLSGPTGVEGRSVVLHVGQEGSLEAKPGVPNERVACGVIGPVSTFQF